MEFSRRIRLVPFVALSSQIVFAQQPVGPKAPAVPAVKAVPKADTAKTIVAPTADDLDKQGKALMDQGKFNDAIIAFKQAVRINPKDIRGFVFLGLAYESVKTPVLAEQAFRSAIALNPQEPSFAFELGNALLSGGKYAAARSEYERAIALNPNDIRYRLAVGRSFVRAKDYSSAREALVKALGYAPDNADVHLALGEVEEQENLHAAALDEFEAVTQIDPKNQEALTDKAIALSELKQGFEAEKIMRDMVAQNPKSADAHAGLAQVLDNNGRHIEAIVEYRSAIQITPDNPDLWQGLGWVEYNAGRLDEAVISSRKALEKDPTLTSVHFNIGLFYAVRNRWAEAEREYSEALRGAAPPDIEAAENDVRDARAKSPAVGALRQAEKLLEQSNRRAIGLPDDATPTVGAHRWP